MSKPLHTRVVPAAFTLLLYEYLESCGEKPVELLGMPWPSTDPDEKGGVEVALWENMLERARQQLGDPLLGLRLGGMVTARHLGVVGHLLFSCENFGSVLQRLEQYQRLIFDVIPMSLREESDWIDVVWDLNEYRTTVLVGETGFATMIQFCRSVIEGDAHPMAIEFAHPAPDDVRPYEEFFQCPVLFGRPEPLIRVGRDLLSRQLVRSDPVLESVLDQHAEHLLSRLPQQEDIVTRVRKVILSQLRDGVPNVQKVSAQLFISPRTLQRQLSEAETSVRTEISLVRNELAISYLQDARLQVADIALLLGYSEHSAFTRAFRKQNGRAPLQVRQQAMSDAK